MDIIDSKTYIIGGEGYIGSMINYLDKSPNVIIVGKKGNPKKSIISINALNEIPKNSNCILLAAITDLKICENNKKLTYETNVELVKKICSLGFNKIVYASTTSLYGFSNDYVDESSPVHSTSYYSETKLMAEEIIMSYKNNIVARLAIAIGASPKMDWKQLCNSIVKNAVDGRELDIYSPDTFRPYYDVSEISRALLFLCFSSYYNNSIVNIGNTSQNYKKSDLLQEIKKIIPSLKWNTIEKNDERNYKVSFAKFEKNFKHSLNFQESFIKLLSFIKYNKL